MSEGVGLWNQRSGRSALLDLTLLLCILSSRSSFHWKEILKSKLHKTWNERDVNPYKLWRAVQEWCQVLQCSKSSCTAGPTKNYCLGLWSSSKKSKSCIHEEMMNASKPQSKTFLELSTLITCKRQKQGKTQTAPLFSCSCIKMYQKYFIDITDVQAEWNTCINTIW